MLPNASTAAFGCHGAPPIGSGRLQLAWGKLGRGPSSPNALLINGARPPPPRVSKQHVLAIMKPADPSEASPGLGASEREHRCLWPSQRSTPRLRAVPARLGQARQRAIETQRVTHQGKTPSTAASQHATHLDDHEADRPVRSLIGAWCFRTRAPLPLAVTALHPSAQGGSSSPEAS